jgi:hypothetical protein
MSLLRCTSRIAIVCGITFLISSCDNFNNAVDVGDLSLPRTVDLQVGQSILLTDVHALVTFDSTFMDNRTVGDSGTVGGFAFISISFHPFSGEGDRYALYTAEGAQEVLWDRYNFRLVALKPLPQTGIVIPRGSYVATIEITEVDA